MVLSADDNGEGGTFALYSPLCRHAKLSLLPNQQKQQMRSFLLIDMDILCQAQPLKRFIEKQKRSRTILLILVIIGASMVIGGGVLTPSISGGLL